MYTAVQADLQSVLTGVGVALLPDRAFLRITGSDATRWLNGMVTNSIQALEPGKGNYNFLLNAQGRIQGDCTIYREPGDAPSYLLATTADQVDTMHNLLDKFIIMDDVELARAYEDQQSLLILGADSPALLQKLGLPEVSTLSLLNASIPNGTVLLLSGFLRNEPRYELRASAAVIATLQGKTAAEGAVPLSLDDIEALRIFSGEPRYSIDIRDRDLPQETNQTHALHFAKGCYLGQEIVERIRSRGQVHRVFTPFQLDGDMPTLPAALEANGKAAGELTSAAQIGSETYALGYARREAPDTKQELTYSGGKAVPRTIAAIKSIQENEKNHG